MRARLATFAGDLLASLRTFDWSELRYLSTSGYWPLAVYIVVCAGSVILVLLVCGLVLLPGPLSSWQATRALSAALADEQGVLLEQVAVNSARNVSIATRCVQCRHLHTLLRPADAMPVIVDRLNDAAAALGITVSRLRPQKLWRQSSVHAYKIDIQVHADKYQLAAFLRDIDNMRVALVTEQIDWRLASSQAQMTLFLLVDGNYPARKTRITNSISSDNLDARVADRVEAGHQGSRSGHWQRVAYIQRGNQYLEVQRDADGEMRRRVGELAGAGASSIAEMQEVRR